jgi:hypothetical protein
LVVGGVLVLLGEGPVVVAIEEIFVNKREEMGEVGDSMSSSLLKGTESKEVKRRDARPKLKVKQKVFCKCDGTNLEEVSNQKDGWSKKNTRHVLLSERIIKNSALLFLVFSEQQLLSGHSLLVLVTKQRGDLSFTSTRSSYPHLTLEVPSPLKAEEVRVWAPPGNQIIQRQAREALPYCAHVCSWVGWWCCSWVGWWCCSLFFF